MQISAVLDVALGLAFTFFLLALIASGIQEVIAGVFSWRGTYLAKAIDVLISNDPKAQFAWCGLGDLLRAHFTHGPGASAAEQFAKMNLQSPALLRLTQQINSHPLLRNIPDALPSYVPASNFSMAVLEVLHDGSSLPVFSQVENTIAALPDGDLKTTLAAFIRDAAGDIDKFRGHLEQWFDTAMDRASGIYKRLSQYVLLVLGILLAVVLNVDAFHLAGTLWHVPAARAAVVADAAGATMHTTMYDALKDFQNEPLPLGWDHVPLSHFLSHVTWAHLTWSQFAGAWAIPGWIVTALAISLGAPFWFDLLQNLSNLRAAGPKPHSNGTQGTSGTSP